VTVGTCPVSGSTEVTLCRERGDLELDQRVLGPSRRDLSPGRVLRCRSCGIGFPATLPSEESLGRLYRDLDTCVGEGERLLPEHPIYFGRASGRLYGECAGLTLIHFGRLASFSVGYVLRRLAQHGSGRSDERRRARAVVQSRRDDRVGPAGRARRFVASWVAQPEPTKRRCH